jgi:hypothetical protein
MPAHSDECGDVLLAQVDRHVGGHLVDRGLAAP